MEPFLKWAGGKRWLINKAEDLLPRIDNIGMYYEPFLGGGSIFFHVRPLISYLSDLNPDLINAYRTIKDNWEELYDMLITLQSLHSKKFYYELRAFHPQTDMQRAARFIYLNRTCWNGLYRVNQKGEFNVPIGTKDKVISEDDDFESMSIALQDTELAVCDFELTINRAQEGDFLFIDPPYTVMHNLNGFLKYNETIFSWQDQVRLKAAVVRAINRGAFVLVTNANHRSIRELYNGVGEMIRLNRSSIIAGDSDARGTCSELAIKSW